MGDSVQTPTRVVQEGEQPPVLDGVERERAVNPAAAEPDSTPAAAVEAEQATADDEPPAGEPVPAQPLPKEPLQETPAVAPAAAAPPATPVVPSPPSGFAALKEKLWAGGVFLWDNKAWALLLFFFGLFVYFNLTRIKPSTEDVPALWNASIKKLGVEPIYPPQEGVMVGDVYLIVAPVREEIRGFLPDYVADTFAGRSIKIGQIDLVPFVLANQPQFSLPKTKFMDSGEPGNEQDGLLENVASDHASKIRLYDIVFPKVVIDRKTDSSAAAKWFTAAFSDNAKDSISFNKVQTFAAPSLSAMAKLQAFCNSMQFCESDKSARTLLSYALGNAINQTYRADGIDRYVFDIEIFVVTQVFATRRITVDNNVGWSDDLNAILLPGKKVEDTTPTEGDTDGGSGDANSAGQQEEDSTRFGYKRSAGTGLSVDASFQRPVVFAYRKVARLLPRDMPAQTPPK